MIYFDLIATVNKKEMAFIPAGNFIKGLKENDINKQFDQLVEVFKNGRVVKEYTLEEVRERARIA